MAKRAQIYMKPYGISDDGRCLGFTPCLQLNDHDGQGFWHGGPGYKDHWRTFSAEGVDAARKYAMELGYPDPDIVYG